MDKNHNRTSSILECLLVSMLIFLVALAISCLSSIALKMSTFSDTQVGVIAEMIGGVIAAVAAGLVLFQLKKGDIERERENDIEEATFLLQYNQAFIQDPNMAEVEGLLEDCAHYGRTEPMINPENRQKFVNYLVYLEGLAPLVLRGVLSLDHIDNLMAYRFYLAVNNPEVQEMELKKFAGDYRGCFKLYKVWTEYRQNNGLDIFQEASALDKWEKFSEYAE